MKFSELVLLLPCHSLEDFPVHNEGDEAEGLLAAWTALWHPNLIAAAGAPTWARVDDPPTQLQNRLMVAPAVSTHELPTGFPQRVKDEGGLLIRKKTDRDEIVQLALEALDDEHPPVDAETVADFHALGFAFLQVELLTRQMRYASNLDELHFNNLVERAAERAVAGDQAGTTEQLQACYDILTQERDHYYAVDSYFIDLTLTAPTTLGETLRDELAVGKDISLLLSGSDLETMAAEHPQTLEALKTAIEEGRACLVGGEWSEERWPLLSLESLRRQWSRARELYQRHLGVVPKVYARRRFGLTPSLPMLLQAFNFDGAFHATLDEGRYPQGVQTKTRWESEDGAVLDAIARPPLDASKPETFLGLAMKLGESMDSDHVATLTFAHWPGRVSPWLRDMQRIAKYHSPLGQFMRADAYFTDTDLPSNLDRFEFDQYRSPYLKQAVIRKQPDPISSSVRYWRRRHTLESTETLASLAGCLTGKPNMLGDVESLALRAEACVETEDDTSLDAEVAQRFDLAAAAAADALPGTGPEVNGVLLLNPQCAARRMRVSTATLKAAPTAEKPVYAVSSLAELPQAIADTPSWGFTWVAEGNGSRAASKRKKSPPLGEEDGNTIVLRNEFFEAVVNRITGTLSAVYTYKTRGNRLSQQLALRSPIPHGQADEQAYSVMAADETRLLYTSETEAVAECRGRLLDREGNRLAGFVQRYTIGRGQRILGLEVELEPDEEPKADPWNSYYACRFAWPDETSPIARTVHQMRVESEARRFESPHYIQIGIPESSTTILTGGLPFHRRTDFRLLDSLLITRGETARSFRLGIGIDLKNPMQEAIAMLTPPAVVSQTRSGPQPVNSSWLFHIDSRNVIATHFSAIERDGAVVGCRVRLLETNGRVTRTKLSAFRSLSTAKQLACPGETTAELDVQDGALLLQLSPHEWIDVEAYWA